MKKLYIVLTLVVVFIVPYWLPLPLVSSGWHSQYEAGDTIEIDLAIWNTTPLNRTINGDQPTGVTLLVDNIPVAVTATDVSPNISRFTREAHTVTYTVSKAPSQNIGFDSATGMIQLPAGSHDISVHWLGSSSWPHRVTIVQL